MASAPSRRSMSMLPGTCSGQGCSASWRAADQVRMRTDLTVSCPRLCLYLVKMTKTKNRTIVPSDSLSIPSFILSSRRPTLGTSKLPPQPLQSKRPQTLNRAPVQDLQRANLDVEPAAQPVLDLNRD